MTASQIDELKQTHHRTALELLQSSSNVIFDAPRVYYLLACIEPDAELRVKGKGHLWDRQRSEARRFLAELPPSPARTRICEVFNVDPGSLGQN